jgi:CheY-like chemotaxis protein
VTARSRLLLIDDDEGMRKYLSRVAEQCGYEVIAVDRGGAFKEAYRACPPDLILVDIFMPQVDGFEILVFLTEQACRVPILLISGSERLYLEAAERLGVDHGLAILGTLKKPIRVEKFRELLQNAHARKARDQSPA